MEEAPENGKELSNSAHANGMNEYTVESMLKFLYVIRDLVGNNNNRTVNCIFTKYHITNKCTNCMSFILNHFFFQNTFHCSYMFRQHIAYHHQGAHAVPS